LLVGIGSSGTCGWLCAATPDMRRTSSIKQADPVFQVVNAFVFIFLIDFAAGWFNLIHLNRRRACPICMSYQLGWCNSLHYLKTKTA
jgi:hypothetical protein